MCGIIGIVGTGPVNHQLYEGLSILQHRGQDSAGIATSNNDRLLIRKSMGLVRDVFRAEHMYRLKGNMGIGHCRYPTAGNATSNDEAQPFYVNSPYGIVLGHNGNLTNSVELEQELFSSDLRHINTTSDSEVLLNVFAHELQEQITSTKLCPEEIFRAVSEVFRRCRGGYAVVAMVIGRGIVAFRDPKGIRPIVLGERESDEGREYAVASESVALQALGFDNIRDLAPGEVIFITHEGELFSKICARNAQLRPCIFEYVYFARPDSIMDDVQVYKSRLRMGEMLSAKILREFADHDIDVVIPIPDTSRTSALELAFRLGVRYREGFMKNRYIGRTFIMPGQKTRKKSVRQKLNAIDLEFRNKNVLLVDDSIVRGTTSEQIVQMARDAGARKVYMASAAPPVKHPNVYGIDMPAVHELIAHNRSVDDICQKIGADWLIYQDIEDLIESVRYGNPSIEKFETSCFTGEYITGDIDADYLERLENERCDLEQQKRLVGVEVV